MSVPVRILPLSNYNGLELPAYQTEQSAGMDLRAAIPDNSPIDIPPGEWRLVPVGIAIALPDGFEAQVRPRSGLAAKNGVTCLNTPGTIDADYRGEIRVNLINHSRSMFRVFRGDRIAQMVVAPVTQAVWHQVEHLEETERGVGGFGSTGI